MKEKKEIEIGGIDINMKKAVQNFKKIRKKTYIRKRKVYAKEKIKLEDIIKLLPGEWGIHKVFDNDNVLLVNKNFKSSNIISTNSINVISNNNLTQQIINEYNNQFIFITICSRPEYLNYINDDIENQKNNNYKWIICFDSDIIPDVEFKNKNVIFLNYKKKQEEITNYAGLNYVFDYIQKNKIDGYIHVIDDDNTIYPDYMNELNNVINSNLRFIYYQQNYYDNTMRFDCRTKEIREGHIDMAQVCFHTSIIEDTRYLTNKYLADGIFYASIFTKVLNNKAQWTIIKKPLCFYNALVNFTKYTPRLLKKKVNIDK